MIEARAAVEAISPYLPLAFIFIGLAFTKRQRLHIIDRDQGVCQFPEKHLCCGSPTKPLEERKLQVHHIIPQRYSEEIGIDPDYEENGITLCKNSHIGPKGIHPDIAAAHSRADFKAIFERREALLKEKKIYWDDSHDRLLHVIAVRNSQKFKKSGRIFPSKHGH